MSGIACIYCCTLEGNFCNTLTNPTFCFLLYFSTIYSRSLDQVNHGDAAENNNDITIDSPSTNASVHDSTVTTTTGNSNPLIPYDKSSSSEENDEPYTPNPSFSPSLNKIQCSPNNNNNTISNPIITIPDHSCSPSKNSYSVTIFDFNDQGKCTGVQASKNIEKNTHSAVNIMAKNCLPVFTRGIKFSSKRSNLKRLSRSRSPTLSISNSDSSKSGESDSYSSTRSSHSGKQKRKDRIYRKRRHRSSSGSSSSSSDSSRGISLSGSSRSRSRSIERSHHVRNSRSRSPSSSSSSSTGSSITSGSRSPSESLSSKSSTKSRKRSRSPSIPRRRGSPSFLDRRRITRYCVV